MIKIIESLTKTDGNMDALTGINAIREVLNEIEKLILPNTANISIHEMSRSLDDLYNHAIEILPE